MASVVPLAGHGVVRDGRQPEQKKRYQLLNCLNVSIIDLTALNLENGLAHRLVHQQCAAGHCAGQPVSQAAVLTHAQRNCRQCCSVPAASLLDGLSVRVPLHDAGELRHDWPTARFARGSLPLCLKFAARCGIQSALAQHVQHDVVCKGTPHRVGRAVGSVLLHASRCVS